MSIKLPATMVFYGESENRPHHLLWWIPPDTYAVVTQDERACAALQADYPNGLEIEVQEEALSEVGVTISQWEVTPPELRAAFLQLHDEGNLPTSGMIPADKLIQLAKMRKSKGIKDSEPLEGRRYRSFSFSGPSSLSPDTANQWQENPDMTEGEDAEDFFKRLSGF